MVRLAGGDAINYDFQESGHAIEVRICAEDPGKDFQPSSGLLTLPAKLFRSFMIFGGIVARQ